MQKSLMNFGFKENEDSIIKVVGVGGAGCNAVNHMYQKGITGVNFIVCNTDIQALQNSPINLKIPLGITLTEGRGAGNNPSQGKQAAIENIEDVRLVFENSTKMIFLTAGMGGGTGTGATPIIAQLAKEMGILTVAVVTIPSPQEGKKRYAQALEGVEELRTQVDSLLVISNEKLHRIYGDLPARAAFNKADEIVANAVKGSAEIITLPGTVNIDFADVETTMLNSGVFLMGTGIGKGSKRATDATHDALQSPLLDSNDIHGAKNILLNIINDSKNEAKLNEIGIIIDTVQKKAGDSAEIIWGTGVDETLNGGISVTIIATGFNKNPNKDIVNHNRIYPEHNALYASKKEENQVPLYESPFEQEEKSDHIEEPEAQPYIEETKETTIEKEEVSEKESNGRAISRWFKKKFGLYNFFDENN
ncbi:MAG: cell division protein FtsZ [Prolixibacteraceae bacterium]